MAAGNIACQFKELSGIVGVVAEEIQMFRICVLFAIAFASIPAAADEGQRFADIGDLALVSGEVLEEARIGYRTVGDLNTDRSNIVVVPTWFTGTGGNRVKFGVVGPDGLIDTNKYHVVVIDAFGNGE